MDRQCPVCRERSPVVVDFMAAQVDLFGAVAAGAASAVRALVKRGADPGEANGGGMTALMLASLRGHEETVRTLVELGADPAQAGRFGMTALMAASNKGHEATVRTLVDLGAERPEEAPAELVQRAAWPARAAERAVPAPGVPPEERGFVRRAVAREDRRHDRVVREVS